MTQLTANVPAVWATLLDTDVSAGPPTFGKGPAELTDDPTPFYDDYRSFPTIIGNPMLTEVGAPDVAYVDLCSGQGNYYAQLEILACPDDQDQGTGEKHQLAQSEPFHSFAEPLVVGDFEITFNPV